MKQESGRSLVEVVGVMAIGAVLIAGGYDKKAPFEEMAGAIQKRAAGLVLVGSAGVRLGEAVAAASAARPARLGPLPVVEAGDDFEKAVSAVYFELVNL